MELLNQAMELQEQELPAQLEPPAPIKHPRLMETTLPLLAQDSQDLMLQDQDCQVQELQELLVVHMELLELLELLELMELLEPLEHMALLE